MSKPALVIEIAVSLLSIFEVNQSTYFLATNLSTIPGKISVRSIILQPMSFTPIASVCFPFNIPSTYTAHKLNPDTSSSFLTIVF